MARISPRRAMYNERVMQRRNRDRLGIQKIREEALAAEAEAEAEAEKKEKKAAEKKPAAKKKAKPSKDK